MWYCVAASAVAGALGAIVAAHFVKVVARLVFVVIRIIYDLMSDSYVVCSFFIDHSPRSANQRRRTKSPT